MKKQLTGVGWLQYNSRIYPISGVHLNKFKIRVILTLENKAKVRISIDLYLPIISIFPTILWCFSWVDFLEYAFCFKALVPGCLTHWEQNPEVLNLYFMIFAHNNPYLVFFQILKPEVKLLQSIIQKYSKVITKK